MASPGPGGRREPLNRDRIVAQAVRLADEHGVKALSMRALAHALGFEVMALYNHVSNKTELLSLMVDAVAAEVPAHDDSDGPLEAVRAVAVSTRSALSRHPWAAELWQQYLPGPARTDLMETLLRLFEESELDPELAHHGFHAVINHVMGYALQESSAQIPAGQAPLSVEEYLGEVSADTHPRTVAHVLRHIQNPPAPSFDLVLDLLLDGLVGLDRTRRRVTVTERTSRT